MGCAVLGTVVVGKSAPVPEQKTAIPRNQNLLSERCAPWSVAVGRSVGDDSAGLAFCFASIFFPASLPFFLPGTMLKTYREERGEKTRDDDEFAARPAANCIRAFVHLHIRAFVRSCIVALFFSFFFFSAQVAVTLSRPHTPAPTQARRDVGGGPVR